jgi:hypothetical protein
VSIKLWNLAVEGEQEFGSEINYNLTSGKKDEGRQQAK